MAGRVLPLNSMKGQKMKKSLLVICTTAMMVTGIATEASARPHRVYDRNGHYVQPRAIGANERVWVDNQGRYRCRRGNGTTGLIIGAAGGALIGRAVDTRGERTTGTILGAVAGGLLGREIDRGQARCR